MTKAVFKGTKKTRSYDHPDGRKIIREVFSDGKSGQWQLLAADGTVIDKDIYRHDLAERHDIELQGWAD